MLMLTIFLRHDQSQNLDEIQARLKQTGFYQSFPPEGVEGGLLARRHGHRPGRHRCACPPRSCARSTG